jgi:thiamine-phosphate pyrophosphorylase
MDAKLVSWARSVKSRHRHERPYVPPLWLFTDAARMPDPLPAIARLPVGLAGVVFRHDGAPDRPALARAAARLCRARRLALVIAGDGQLAHAVRAGAHLRGGQSRPRGRWARLATGSAHTVAELQRATRNGVSLVFISPVFATSSHPGALSLGPLRWAILANRLSRGGSARAAALGGVDGSSARRLPRRLCRAAGAIGAFVA